MTDTFDKKYIYNYLNIQSIDDLLNSSLSQSYEYDLIDRLTNAQGRYGDLSYTYDSISNCTNKVVNSVEIPYTYSDGVLNSVNGVNRSYDAIGNTLNDGTRSYQHNQAGRLIKTKSGTVEYDYQYNFLGQRTNKQWQAANSNQNDHCKVVEVIKNVNVRSEPDKNSTKVGYIKVGQKYVETGQQGNWRRIWYQNEQRWVYGRGYLEGSIEQCFEIANTRTGNVNVRASNTSSSEKRGTAPEGSMWVLDNSQGNWLSFWYDAELSFVHSNYAVIDEKNSSNQRYYQYDSSGILIAEFDGSGKPLIEYIYLNGKRIAFVTADEIYYIHTNHLDAPVAITNSNGEPVWTGYYTPFGKLVETKNELSEEMALRFPGQYADAEAGLYYNYFRDYDPELGRYIQSDPIGLKGGINTYAYALANPVKYTDPLGLDVTICRWAGPIPHIGMGVNTSQTTGRRVNKETPALLKPFILGGSNIFGEVSDDDMNSAEECKTVKASSQQDRDMQRYIDNAIKNPGQYNLYNNSCVDFVRDGFNQILGLPLSNTNLPGALYNEIGNP